MNLLDPSKPCQLMTSFGTALHFQNWLFTMITAGQSIVAACNDEKAKDGLLAEIKALTQLQQNISIRHQPTLGDSDWVSFQAYIIMSLYEFLKSEPYSLAVLSAWDGFRWTRAQSYAVYHKASSPARLPPAFSSSSRNKPPKPTTSASTKRFVRGGGQMTRYDENGSFRKGMAHPFDSESFTANPDVFSCHNCRKAGWGARACPCNAKFARKEGYEKFRPKKPREGGNE